MTPRSRKPRAGAAIVLLALSLVLVQASPQPRVDRSRFGIVTFDLDGPVPAKLSELGSGLVRGSCNWNDLEPERGVFSWGCSDDVIVGAQKQGLRSYITVTCTPDWANLGAGCAAMPADLTDWYDLVESFVSRYRLYNTILGVWNEPNLTLQDDADGTNYALLFINASNARNVVDRWFVLAGPETSHHAVASGYYAHTIDTIQSWRAFEPQDVVSVHWYDDGPPLAAYMDAVESSAGYQEVWLSETGYAGDPAAQASFFEVMLASFVYSGRPWWTHIIFYRLWDGQDCCTEAILDADYTNKPAFETYRRWIATSNPPILNPQNLSVP
jgi:hypothetical protein